MWGWPETWRGKLRAIKEDGKHNGDGTHMNGRDIQLQPSAHERTRHPAPHASQPKKSTS